MENPHSSPAEIPCSRRLRRHRFSLRFRRRLWPLAALLPGLVLVHPALSSAQVPKLLLNSATEEIPGANWGIQQLTRIGFRLAFADDIRGGLFAFDPRTRRTSVLFDPTESDGYFQGNLMGGGDEDLFASYPAAEARPLGGTDGTFAGSRLLPESAFPGVSFGAPASLDPRWQARSQHVILSAYQTGEGAAFWASDATAVGTFRISNPLAASSVALCESAPLTGGLLLPVARGDGSTELWLTDGTPSGSLLSATVPYEFSLGAPFSLDSRAIYPCSAGPDELGLCSTDGTAAGTHFLGVRLQSDFLGGGNIAYFKGRQNGIVQLWRSDGTPAGTFALDAPATPKVASIQEDSAAALLRGLVTRVLPNDAPAEIWLVSADGASAQKLATPCDVSRGCPGLTSNQIWRLSDFALFFAFDRERGSWLWATDGTLQGTRPILDMNEIELGRAVLAEDGRWYALGRSPDFIEQLYVSDGTPAGSLRLTEFTNQQALSWGGAYAPELAILGERVWFAAFEPESGRQLYSANPRQPGAVQETLWNQGAVNWPAKAGGRPGLIGLDRPCAFDPADGGLWVSDGTPQHSLRALEPPPGTCGGFPISSTGTPYAWGTGLAVPWRGLGDRYQLYWLGGVGQPPQQTTSFPDGDVYNAAQVGSASVYEVRRQDDSWALWASDAPATAARFLADLPADTAVASRLQPLANLALFAISTANRCEIARTDATSAGTFELGFSALDLFCPDLYQFTVTQTGNRGYFLLIDADQHGAIWETDGTVANTRQFTAPNLRVLRILQPALIDGRIVFAADEDGQPSGLYAQTPDFTAEQRLTDLAPVQTPGNWFHPTLAAATSSRVFVTGFDAEHGQELWSADASGGPFTRLRDIAPGSRSSHPTNLTVVGDQLLFSANDDVHGRELWISDGTSAGTRMIWEVAQGGFSSFPSSLTAIGTDLVFSAFHPLIGQEVWILPLGPEAPGLIFDDNFESGSTAQWERSPF